MTTVPEALIYTQSIMQCEIMKEFGIPERNQEMAVRLQEYVDRGGKYLRPAIVLSTIKTYTPERVDIGIWPARSINYDHNFFLIHDDFEDSSFLRRGKPTMHEAYGDDFAINYGDYLRSIAELAMDKVSDLCDSSLYERLVKARHEMLRTTAEGQDLEFMLRSSPLSEMTEERVFDILVNKTGVYTIWTPYRYGGIISRLSDTEMEHLKKPLIDIGVAFQITDDVLDIIVEREDETGSATLEEQKFGKDWAGDLEEIKRTLLLEKVVNIANPDEKEFLYRTLDVDGQMVELVGQRDALRKQGIERTDDRYSKLQLEIDHIKFAVIDLMKKYGVIKECQTTAHKLYEDSIGVIEEALPESQGKDELLELFYFALGRHF